jgi:hypothetical protein
MFVSVVAKPQTFGSIGKQSLPGPPDSWKCTPIVSRLENTLPTCSHDEPSLEGIFMLDHLVLFSGGLGVSTEESQHSRVR